MKAELKTRQGHVQKTVMTELSKVIDQLGLATKKDLEELKKTKKTTAKKTVKK